MASQNIATPAPPDLRLRRDPAPGLRSRGARLLFSKETPRAAS